MCSVQPIGDADGAGVGEPLLAVAVDEPVALGAGVVLVDHRAEPLDHLLLDRDRARRGGVDDALQRRHVVAGADLGGQLEQADEHRRHDLGVGDAVALDRARGTARRRSAPSRRRCRRARCTLMEKRSGAAWYSGAGDRYTDVVGRRRTAAAAAPATPVGVVSSGSATNGRRDALRQPGRARRVEHVGAGDAVGAAARPAARRRPPRTTRSRRSCRRASGAASTPGVSATISAAWSALYVDVMKTLASQSLTM